MRRVVLWLLCSLCVAVRADSIYTHSVPITFDVPNGLRTEDIRTAYPDLRDEDRMLPICFNSMIGGGITLIRYVRDLSPERIVLKRASCKFVERALMCTDLDTSELFSYESADPYFSLAEDVPYQEAVRVIRAFKDRGIRGLPDWYRGMDYRQVRRIVRSANGYLLGMGDVLCLHCTAQFDVKFEDDTQLVLMNEPGGRCI
jgi:hypothetical protein